MVSQHGRAVGNVTSAMPVARRRSYSSCLVGAVQRARGLVQDDDAGRAGQDPRKRQALLLAGGQQLFQSCDALSPPTRSASEPSCTSSSSSSNWSSVSLGGLAGIDDLAAQGIRAVDRARCGRKNMSARGGCAARCPRPERHSPCHRARSMSFAAATGAGDEQGVSGGQGEGKAYAPADGKLRRAASAPPGQGVSPSRVMIWAPSLVPGLRPRWWAVPPRRQVPQVF